MLTAKQREELRKLIEAEIRELEEIVIGVEGRFESVTPDASVGRLSRMDSLVNKGTAEMALAEAQKKLRRLKEKLARINEPDFGRCAGCGEWIPMDRLRAAPERGVCVPCLNKKPTTGNGR